MSNIPGDLRYTKTHEWVRKEDDGTVTVGITDHAQQLLGDMVFVELPELEQSVSTGDEVCVVESVKAASDVYGPINGTVVSVNEALNDSPELVNSDPYHDGWLFKLHPEDLEETQNLLDEEAYKEAIESEQ